MSFKWVRSLFASKEVGPQMRRKAALRVRAPQRFRPSVDVLEDRLVPTVTVVSGVQGADGGSVDAKAPAESMAAVGPTATLQTYNLGALLTTNTSTPPVDGFGTDGKGTGVGWTANNTGGFSPNSSNNVLTLTTAAPLPLPGPAQATSFIDNTKVGDGVFTTEFSYTELTPTGTGGTGITFMLEGDPAKTNALGTSGAGLGYMGIMPSFSVGLSVSAAGTLEYQFGQDGVFLAAPAATGMIIFAPGTAIQVDVAYDGNTVTLTLNDGVNTFSATDTGLNLLADLGNTAYVGFTGGTDGTNTSVQSISNFSYQNAASADLGNGITFTRSSTIIPVVSTFSQPFCVYDDDAQRFIIGELETDPTSERSWLHFAVSNDSSPTNLSIGIGGSFAEVHSIELTETSLGPINGTLFGEDPNVGFNQDGIFFTVNMFSFSSAGYDHTQIIAVETSTLLDQNSATMFNEPVVRAGAAASNTPFDRSNVNFGMVPAREHGAIAGTPEYFVSTLGQQGETAFVVKGVTTGVYSSTAILVTAMTNYFTANPGFIVTTLTVPNYGSSSPIGTPGLIGNVGAIPNIIQPGINGHPANIPGNDTEILSVAWTANYLVAAQTAIVNNQETARWYEINTSVPSTATLVQSGNISPGPGVFTYVPAIDIARTLDIGLTYMESSSVEFPSMYITGRTSTDPLGTMEASVKAQAGTSSLGPTGPIVPQPVGVFSDAASSFIVTNPLDPTQWSPIHVIDRSGMTPPVGTTGTHANDGADDMWWSDPLTDGGAHRDEHLWGGDRRRNAPSAIHRVRLRHHGVADQRADLELQPRGQHAGRAEERRDSNLRQWDHLDDQRSRPVRPGDRFRGLRRLQRRLHEWPLQHPVHPIPRRLDLERSGTDLRRNGAPLRRHGRESRPGGFERSAVLRDSDESESGGRVRFDPGQPDEPQHLHREQRLRPEGRRRRTELRHVPVVVPRVGGAAADDHQYKARCAWVSNPLTGLFVGTYTISNTGMNVTTENNQLFLTIVMPTSSAATSVVTASGAIAGITQVGNLLKVPINGTMVTGQTMSLTVTLSDPLKLALPTGLTPGSIFF